MVRGLCWILIAALCLCGCAKKDQPRETTTAEAQPPPAPPAESNVPTPPAESEHPILATTRAFLNALAAGNYGKARSLTVPGESIQELLAGMHEAFQWDPVTFTHAWAGAEQAAVITNPVPATQGSVTAAWAFNLVRTEDGHWLVRLADMVQTPQIIEDYLAAFREVAPDAKSIEP
jgi:hypothetical protein